MAVYSLSKLDYCRFGFTGVKSSLMFPTGSNATEICKSPQAHFTKPLTTAVIIALQVERALLEFILELLPTPTPIEQLYN